MYLTTEIFLLHLTADHLKFAVDGQEIGRVDPPEGGFWQLGEFESRTGNVDNPWVDGTKMAPFDKEVSYIY